MKFNLTREEMHDHLKVKKAALLSIAINVLEIIAGMVMMLLVRKVLLGGVEESIVRMVSLMCFTIVGWGALTDIGASLTSLRMVRRTQELEEAYVQLEDLNREMRGVDRETDVLSFPTASFRPGRTAGMDPARVRRQYDPSLGWCNLGDCVISLSRAREQAAEYGHSVRRELGYLSAHGLLHLCGYDHETDEERAQMREREEAALSKCCLTRDD